MEHPEIFSATLGISHPWLVTSVVVHSDGTRLDISVDFASDWEFSCPQCGTSMNCYGAEHEIWHHHDFFSCKTYLHARVPQIQCATCGRQPVERPWSRAGSLFAQKPCMA